MSAALAAHEVPSARGTVARRGLGGTVVIRAHSYRYYWVRHDGHRRAGITVPERGGVRIEGSGAVLPQPGRALSTRDLASLHGMQQELSALRVADAGRGVTVRRNY